MAKKRPPALFFKSHGQPLPPGVMQLFREGGDETSQQLAPVRRVDSLAALTEGLGLPAALEAKLGKVQSPVHCSRLLGEHKVDPDIRQEIMTRAMIYFRDQQQLTKGVKPPAGYSAIPNSSKGGFRKRSGQGWIYWYPGTAEQRVAYFSSGADALRQAVAADAKKHAPTENKVEAAVLHQAAFGPSVQDPEKLVQAWKVLNPGGTDKEFQRALDKVKGVKAPTKAAGPSPEATQKLWLSMEGHWRDLEEQALSGKSTAATVAAIESTVKQAAAAGHPEKTLLAIRQEFNPNNFPAQKQAVVEAMATAYRKITNAAIPELKKGASVGGKYYKRVPTGNPKRPWRYYYTKQAYEAARHVSGPKAHDRGPVTRVNKAAEALRTALAGQKEIPNAHGEMVPIGKASRVWVKGTDFGLPSQTVKAHATVEGTTEFGEPNYQFKPERAAFHAEMVDAVTRDVPVVPQNKIPVAVVMMGGGGSGKGSVLKAILHDEQDFVHVDSDEFKKKIPEYQQAMNLGRARGLPITAKDAAWMAHEESGFVAEQALAAGLAQRKNVILDGTGKNAEKHTATVLRLKAAGYRVQLIYAHAEKDSAVQRAADRADRSGRYVPLDVLEDAHSKIPQNFEPVAAFADSYQILMSQPPPDPPKKVLGGPPREVQDAIEMAEFERTALRLAEMQKSGNDYDDFEIDVHAESVTTKELLERIRKNYVHYPIETTDENLTEGSELELEAAAKALTTGRAVTGR